MAKDFGVIIRDENGELFCMRFYESEAADAFAKANKDLGGAAISFVIRELYGDFERVFK